MVLAIASDRQIQGNHNQGNRISEKPQTRIQHKLPSSME